MRGLYISIRAGYVSLRVLRFDTAGLHFDAAPLRFDTRGLLFDAAFLRFVAYLSLSDCFQKKKVALATFND